MLYHTNMRMTKSALMAERMATTFRWLTLVVLTLAIGGKGDIDLKYSFLIVISGLWNLVLTILPLLKKRFPQQNYITTAVDTVIGLLFFFL
ncbi:MAG: hypothetical protein PVF83_11170, partial [Anaerolineales bacterium]